MILFSQWQAQMLTMQDESSQSGVKLTPMEISREVLGVGKKTRYLRGFGIGPKISSFRSSAASQARDKEVEKLRADLDKQNRELEIEREEQQKEREEQQRKFDEQEKKIEEQRKMLEDQQIQFDMQQKRMEDLHSLVGQLLQERNEGRN